MRWVCRVLLSFAGLVWCARAGGPWGQVHPQEGIRQCSDDVERLELRIEGQVRVEVSQPLVKIHGLRVHVKSATAQGG